MPAAEPSARSRAPWIVVAVVAAAAVGAVVFAAARGGSDASGASLLRDRGRLVALGDPGVVGALPAGTSVVPLDEVAAVRDALGGDDERALAAALDRDEVDGVLVDARRRGDGPTLSARLSRYEHVTPLRGVFLSPEYALFVRRTIPDMAPPLDEALERVARGILEGRRPPRESSFPAALRADRSCEVMVLLRRGRQPRLWRSARGASISRALVTAAVVARQRWQEREDAMGGPLDDALPHLQVEVSLLEEDGTLAVTADAFLARVMTPRHGAGYERKGTWRYLLPRATVAAGGGRAAFEELVTDNGFAVDALARPDFRFYRLVVTPLAVSPAPALPAVSPSPGGEDDEGFGSDDPFDDATSTDGT